MCADHTSSDSVGRSPSFLALATANRIQVSLLQLGGQRTTGTETSPTGDLQHLICSRFGASQSNHRSIVTGAEGTGQGERGYIVVDGVRRVRSVTVNLLHTDCGATGSVQSVVSNRESSWLVLVAIGKTKVRLGSNLESNVNKKLNWNKI